MITIAFVLAMVPAILAAVFGRRVLVFNLEGAAVFPSWRYSRSRRMNQPFQPCWQISRPARGKRVDPTTGNGAMSGRCSTGEISQDTEVRLWQ